MTYGILALIHCCLPPSIHFASVWIASVLPDHLWTNTPLADSHEAWLSSTDLATLAQPVTLITVEERWRMWWKRDNRGATCGKLYLT